MRSFAMLEPSRTAVYSHFASIYIVWGSTYLAILFAIRSIPPLLMAGTRFLIAGAILYLAARLSGAKATKWVDWRTAAIVGACLLLGGNGGVTLAEQYVPSGLAALLVATIPIYMALLSWLIGMSPRPNAPSFAGLVVASSASGCLSDLHSSFPPPAKTRKPGSA